MSFLEAYSLVNWVSFFLTPKGYGGRKSGIAMLEKTLSHTKPGYESYRRTTKAFIPWFPHTPAISEQKGENL